MRISAIELVDKGSHQQLTATIDRLTLWFRIPPGIPLNSEDATPFVQFCLIPAMMLGEDIEVDEKYGVSPRFHNSIKAIHRIYNTWNPVFKPVQVTARLASPEFSDNGFGSPFSSGVDGTYTFLQHREQLNRLVYINGFEANYPTEKWAAMVSKNQEFASAMGIELVPVETNHRSFLAAFGLSGFSNFAFRLAAIGQILGFSSVYVSGADTYRVLFPAGSHPLVDPLLSTEATEILHVGLEADRADKIARIAQCPSALRNLNFCQRGGVSNCGRCGKCVRTYVALQLNNIDDFPFDQPLNLAYIARTRIANHEQAEFYQSFLDTAERREMTELASIIRRRLVRYKLRNTLLEVESAYFPFLKRLRKARVPDEDLQVSVNIFPRYSDQAAVDYYRQRLHSESFRQEVHDIGTVFESAPGQS